MVVYILINVILLNISKMFCDLETITMVDLWESQSDYYFKDI